MGLFWIHTHAKHIRAGPRLSPSLAGSIPTPTAMKAKLTYLLIAALAVLGGLNIFQSLKQELLPPHEKGAHVAERTVASYAGTLTEAGEAVIDVRFDVSPGDALDVRVAHTDVVIETGSDKEAHIVVTLDGRDMDRAREVFEAMNFRVAQDGDVIRVVSESPNRKWSWGSNDVQITVMARVPERFDAEIETSHGDLSMNDLEGRIDVRTSHGDVAADALSGPRLHIETSHGDVAAGRLSADEVSVKTSHGDIEIGEVVSSDFSAHTSHADVEVARIEGRAEITNSHGDIRALLTSGQPAFFKTSHGDIAIDVIPDLGADVTLRGDKVRLDASASFDGEVKKSRADGRLNGGGARIEARTSHGSITLREE